ncbi:hypothetical protein AVEN_19308-1 [Araneus ventricosus]|uniref:Uncharacterized protein n=1 Tax=Araneus ventricosus TaxID=182803 RepID=A0A4Y2JVX4_ARAVE|nr:hypothetical protein AVEN_19308-1 [Araneus ventricosus]
MYSCYLTLKTIKSFAAATRNDDKNVNNPTLTGARTAPTPSGENVNKPHSTLTPSGERIINHPTPNVSQKLPHLQVLSYVPSKWEECMKPSNLASSLDAWSLK